MGILSEMYEYVKHIEKRPLQIAMAKRRDKQKGIGRKMPWTPEELSRIQSDIRELQGMAKLLKCKPLEVYKTVRNKIGELRGKEREIERLKRELLAKK